MQRLLDLVVAAAPGGFVVDVGCGRGDTCAHLASRGLNVLGLEPDLSPDVASRFTDHANVELLPIELAELDRPAIIGIADAVALFGVIHYASDRNELKDLLDRALALGRPEAPVALTWITPDIPVPGAYLPPRDVVSETLAAHNRAASEWWEVGVRHRHGGAAHEHRIAYTWWTSDRGDAGSS